MAGIIDYLFESDLEELKYRIESFATVSFKFKLAFEVITVVIQSHSGDFDSWRSCRKIMMRARVPFLSFLKLLVSKFNELNIITKNSHKFCSYLQNARPFFPCAPGKP